MDKSLIQWRPWKDKIGEHDPFTWKKKIMKDLWIDGKKKRRKKQNKMTKNDQGGLLPL